jgi:hypothetical protein
MKNPGSQQVSGSSERQATIVLVDPDLDRTVIFYS